MAFYADCLNISLVVAGLRPGCRLECRDWDVDSVIGICQLHRSFSVVSPWLDNMMRPGHFHVFFNHDVVRRVDVQTIRDEMADDSPLALGAYKRVLGYPCGMSLQKTNQPRFRASVLIILNDTKTGAMVSLQLFACSCPVSRYAVSMKYMETFAARATELMSGTRLGEHVVRGFASCDF
jgi:hypothetical protein